MEKSLRYRIQVASNQKGGKSWEAVVDGEGWTEAEILRRSDSLCRQLEQRYPPVEEKGK